jgi:dihydrofolate synthase/folylpolyglutamate synthase
MIDWLYDLQHFGIKLGLDNIRAMLEILGRPQDAFRSIHVGGTNGKGSVASMLHAMLEAEGLGAGMFTSPHLVRPNERIRLRHEDIGDDELERRLAAMRDRIERATADGTLEHPPSFFEVIAATALDAFRDHGLDAAVLEVGLGGRLDATNAVDCDVSVIVSVDLDHTKSLGPTLDRIAYEKSGIIKPGRPCVSGVVRQKAVDVVRETCRERGAPFVDARTAVRLVSEDRGGFTLETDRQRYPDLRPALAGRHQIDNARVALAAFETFADSGGFAPCPDRVREALASVRWPGRLQWIRGEGDVDMLLMHGKLLDRMIEPIAPLVDRMVVTRPDVRRAADPDEVATIARSHLSDVEVVAAPAEALERARELVQPGQYLLITGSLYLLGQILCLLPGRAAPGPVSM